ncbi:MAG TPA: cyclic nucleotide-binding domain-containing protein, partial [Actinomycetota bacterium]|nr:cyclic nucleotide-binding domain-containing protein [Actinomycetota bacterium]
LMERILFLRKVPLFADLAPADVKRVAEVAAEHAFPDGAVIAESGEWGDEMHIVVSGEIRVRIDGAGPGAEIARRRPGDYVGEMSIITGEPRMASLVAAGEVRTLSIDRKRFERILLERPQASLAVMRGLCLRLQEAHRQADPAASPR